jgi:hypothetical protein
LVQLEHGSFLSHLTFRRRHVTQERALRPVGGAVGFLSAGLWGFEGGLEGMALLLLLAGGRVEGVGACNGG